MFLRGNPRVLADPGRINADMTPDSASLFSDLVGDIYDVALDCRLWNDALARIRDFVGGCTAAVYVKTVGGDATIYHYSDNYITPYFRELYVGQMVKCDPTTAAQFLAEPGKPVSMNDVMPMEEFRHSRIFKNWAKPQGLMDQAVVVLDREPQDVVLAAVLRSEMQGMVDDEMLHRLGLIGPHLRRAAQIARAAYIPTSRQASLKQAVDALKTGVVFLDGAGRILHANEAAEALLGGLRSKTMIHERLGLTNRAADQQLRDLIAHAATGEANRGNRSVTITVNDPAGGVYLLHALPLTAGKRRQLGQDADAVVALYLRKAEFAPASVPQAIATQFNLTPSELRVLLAIVDGGGVGEAADTLGLGEATVKTHLHRIFSKTGTARQAELVKLVAAYSSPLLHA